MRDFLPEPAVNGAVSGGGAEPHPPHLAIGCFASMCRDRLGDDLVAFTDRLPDVTIGIHEMPRAALLRALADGEIVAAIVPGEPAARFEAKRLWSDRVVAAMPANHPLAASDPIAAEALADELFLVSRFQHGWDMHRFLAGQILPGRTPRAALHDFGVKRLLGLVGAGEGVALLCRSHVAHEPAGVVVRDIAGPAARFEVQVQWSRETVPPVLAGLLAALEPDAAGDIG